MLAAYLFCLLAGGALVAISAIFGGKDADVGGHDASADADVDAGGDGDAGGDVDVHAHAHADVAHGGVGHVTDWLPFLSLQFWTFALAFFGLTGTVLTLLDFGAIPTLIAALALGIGSGTTVSTAIKRLRKEHVSSSIGVGDFAGRSGVVRVPLKAGSAGKIRISAKGSLIDVIATTDEQEEIRVGEEVLVTEMQDGRAVVVRAVRVEQPSTLESEVSASGSRGPRADERE